MRDAWLTRFFTATWVFIAAFFVAMPVALLARHASLASAVAVIAAVVTAAVMISRR